MCEFNQRKNLHDSVLSYLNESNYQHFRSPMFLIDKELSPLRNLLNNQDMYRNDEVFHYMVNLAKNQNPFYKELTDRFTNSIHHPDVIKKLGDFILEISNSWHIFELKTSDHASLLYHYNIDSYLIYRHFPSQLLPYNHVLFYNDCYKTFYAINVTDLIVEPNYFHYPELSSERKKFIEEHLPGFTSSINYNECSSDIDRTTNAYLTIDLSKQKPGALLPLDQYISNIKQRVFY